MSIQRVLEIRRKISEITEPLEAMLKKAENEKRDLSLEEKSRFDKGMERAEPLKIEEERLIREFGLAGQLGQSLGHLAIDPGGLPGDGQIMVATGAARDRSYRGMFHQVTIENGGFESGEEFLRMIANNTRDKRIEARATMVEGTDTLGGFSVPSEFASRWLDSSIEAEIIRPRANVYPMASDTLHIPQWDDSDRSASNFGGFEGVWLAENAAATRQTGKLGQLKLMAKKLAIFAQCSREVAQDGVNFEDQLTRGLIKSLNYSLDYAFIQGNGVGKPLGILQDPAKIPVARGGAGAIDFDDVLNVFSRLHPACTEKSIWLSNPKCIPSLMKLYVETGTSSGSHVPVLTGSGGRYELLFRPIIFTDKVPTLGTEGDLMLVDISQYQIGMRQEVVLDRSIDPGWTNDSIDFRVILRVDGQGGWKSAVTPRNGDTLSWIVALSDAS